MLPEVAKQLQVSPDAATLAKYTDLVTNITQVANAAQGIDVSADIAKINKDKIVDELKKTASSFASFGLGRMADYLRRGIDNVVVQAPGVINQAINSATTTGGFVFDVAEYAVVDGGDDVFNVIDAGLSSFGANGGEEFDIVDYIDGGDIDGPDIVDYMGAEDVIIGANEDQLNYELLYTGSGETEKCYLIGADIEDIINRHKKALVSIEIDVRNGIADCNKYYKKVLVPKIRSMFHIYNVSIEKLSHYLDNQITENPIGWLNSFCPLFTNKLQQSEDQVIDWMKKYVKHMNWEGERQDDYTITEISKLMEKIRISDHKKIRDSTVVYTEFRKDPKKGAKNIRKCIGADSKTIYKSFSRRDDIYKIMQYNDKLFELIPKYEKIKRFYNDYSDFICDVDPNKSHDESDIKSYYILLKRIVDTENTAVHKYLKYEKILAKIARLCNDVHAAMNSIYNEKSVNHDTLTPMINVVESILLLQSLLYSSERHELTISSADIDDFKKLHYQTMIKFNIHFPPVCNRHIMDIFTRKFMRVKVDYP
jgi:hypothetical protein